jgi:glycosyltransferase involved in cell wall biosynthesis
MSFYRTFHNKSDAPPMSSPLRLLQIVDSLQPGGMENILVQLVSRLDPDRFSVEICCLTQTGPFEKRLPEHVKVSVLSKHPGFQWSTVAALRAVVQRGRFDVMHSHHLGGLIYSSLATLLPHRPRIVHSEHSLWDTEELSPKRRWQRKLLYRRASAVFTVSHQQINQMKSVGLGHRRLFTILNGVDSERFTSCADKKKLRSQLGLEPEARWVGMVARFGALKRHYDLIEAFDIAAASSPDLRLLLVGDGGPEKERALARFGASAYKNRIYWAGFQQDPVPWYQAMDALVVSSANEGMPNAVLEGMACGLPLVANDVCGVSEIARDGEHGWISDLGTVDLLAQALGLVATRSSEQLETIGLEARSHVQRHFSLNAMVGAYDTLFTSLRS